MLVSDNLDHTKNTVIPYVNRLHEELPKNIREVTIWSDGPTSHFKNRYIAEAIKVIRVMPKELHGSTLQLLMGRGQWMELVGLSNAKFGLV